MKPLFNISMWFTAPVLQGPIDNQELRVAGHRSRGCLASLKNHLPSADVTIIDSLNNASTSSNCWLKSSAGQGTLPWPRRRLCSDKAFRAQFLVTARAVAACKSCLELTIPKASGSSSATSTLQKNWRSKNALNLLSKVQDNLKVYQTAIPALSQWLKRRKKRPILRKVGMPGVKRPL